MDWVPAYDNVILAHLTSGVLEPADRPRRECIINNHMIRPKSKPGEFRLILAALRTNRCLGKPPRFGMNGVH
jgi:hypothetical protein